MRHSRLLQIASLALLVSVASCGATIPTRPPADMTITTSGCTTSNFLLPAEREPLISVENQAQERMVFTIPTMNRWIALGQGERANFELPRYIMGRFDFFCLTEADHTTAAGGNPYICVMEPAELVPVARSSGIFEIEQHNRVEEVLQGTPAPTP